MRETFFSWAVFKDAFPEVLDGFWLDVKLFVIVEVAVLIVGLVDRPGPHQPRRRRSSRCGCSATVCVDLFRGVPTILLVYLIGFGDPGAAAGRPADRPGRARRHRPHASPTAPTSPRSTGPGSRSVHRGQRDAALAVGLTEAQAMRHVILPQAVRRVAPPLLNDFVALQKDVALVSILGPLEAFRIAQIVQGENFNYTPLIAAALLYLAVTVPLARVVDRIGGGPEGAVR